MSEEKKIIIDEDWKSQVESEKEALAKDKSESPQPADEAQAMPAPSFEMLLTTLATEAMMSLGQLPNLANEKVEINFPQARYVIDMMQMLEEKTKGNLTQAEQDAITALLHQLRMMFVSVQQMQGLTPAAESSESKPGEK